MDHVVSKFGLPDDIISDRGPVSAAQLTRAFMTALNVQQNLSTAFHSQSRVKVNTPEASRRTEVLKQTQEDLKFHIEGAQESQAFYHDQNAQPAPEFAPGDRVWLVRKHIRASRPSSKLDCTKLGPFKILRAVGTRASCLDLPRSMHRIHPAFHVSLLEPYLRNSIPGRIAQPPPPIEVAGDVEWKSRTF